MDKTFQHVIHYAQGHARLFPELGRILRKIDLDTQTSEKTNPSQLSSIDVKFGTAQIKKIILEVPHQTKANKPSVKLGDIKQAIEYSEQKGNTLTINLESKCEIYPGLKLTIFLAFNE